MMSTRELRHFWSQWTEYVHRRKALRVRLFQIVQNWRKLRLSRGFRKWYRYSDRIAIIQDSLIAHSQSKELECLRRQIIARMQKNRDCSILYRALDSWKTTISLKKRVLEQMCGMWKAKIGQCLLHWHQWHTLCCKRQNLVARCMQRWSMRSLQRGFFTWARKVSVFCLHQPDHRYSTRQMWIERGLAHALSRQRTKGAP